MVRAMSDSTTPPTLREARAAVFAAVCVLVAAVSHGAMSDVPVPAHVLAGATVAVYLGARLVAHRERGLAVILAAMTLVQASLHAVFALAQRGAGSMPAGTPATSRMFCGDKQPDLSALLMHIGAAPAAHPRHSMTAGMACVHGAIALAAAWWLRHGEAAAWNMARAVVLFLVGPLLVLFGEIRPPVHPAAVPRATAPVRTCPGLLLRHFVTRRGPPVAVRAHR